LNWLIVPAACTARQRDRNRVARHYRPLASCSDSGARCTLDPTSAGHSPKNGGRQPLRVRLTSECGRSFNRRRRHAR